MQPSMDIEDLSLGLYYTAYCVSTPTLCSSDHIRSQGNGCLWSAIQLLGMMQVSRTWLLPNNKQDLVLQYYSKATTLLNAALVSPADSHLDSTLLASLLLSVAEMKQSPDFSLNYWSMHTQGMAALLELRGPDQVSTRIGSALFLQISSQIVIYCILGQRPIPIALMELRSKMQQYVVVTEHEHPLWRWHGVMYRVVNFWAAHSQPRVIDGDNVEHTAGSRSTSAGAHSDGSAERVIAEAHDILKMIHNVFQDAGSYWPYSIRILSPYASAFVTPLIRHSHIFHSLVSARVWNDRHTAQILLYTIVARVSAAASLPDFNGTRIDSQGEGPLSPSRNSNTTRNPLQPHRVESESFMAHENARHLYSNVGNDYDHNPRTMSSASASDMATEAHAALQATAHEVLASVPQPLAGITHKSTRLPPFCKWMSGLHLDRIVARGQPASVPNEQPTGSQSAFARDPIADSVPDSESGPTGSDKLTASGLNLCNSASEYDEHVFRQSYTDYVKLPYMDTCKVQWPIYLAVRCEFIEPVVKRYLVKVLESAGKVLGMNIWEVLAARAQDGIDGDIGVSRKTSRRV